MITDPLCLPKDTKEAIIAFTKFTQKREKECLLFPIDQTTARRAAEIGYGLLQVGVEPVFHFKTYSPNDIDKKTISAVNQVLEKGIKIECLSYIEIEDRNIEPEFNEILNEWLLSRRSGKMRLLSEVSPLKFKENKRYFVASLNNKIEAFLACSPIFARNGYFVHDLIRRPTAMNGISEALIIAALTLFKEEGCDFASLGTAPLAGLTEPGANFNYRLLNKLLVHVFNSHDTFMRFKSLYNFKKKFKPSAEEPTYFAFYPPRLKLQNAMAIMELFSGQGFIGDLIFKLKRWVEGNQLPRPLLNLLSPNVATLARPIPFTLMEFILRLRFTFLIFTMNVYTYFSTTNVLGDLNLDVVHKYGFNYHDFLSHKWLILITSNFLHFSYWHLIGNMIMLFIFCGTLEFVAGSTVAALSFVVGMDANVPTGMVLLPLLKSINFNVWEHVITYMDVGASLGIMANVGALIQFLKNKRMVLLATCLITVVLSLIHREYFGLDHTFAIIMGYGVGYLYLNQRYRIRGFQRFFASVDHPLQHNSPIPFRSRSR